MTTAPISSHPGFRYAVALWFAALLGLGLYVMPTAVHDALAGALGLGTVLPAAQPPVAPLGRAILAGLAALLGLVLGLAIAWRIARATDLESEDEADFADHGSDTPRARPLWLDEDAETPLEQPELAHRVFNAREDLDETGIAGPPAQEPAVASAAQDDDEPGPDAWGEDRGFEEEPATILDQGEPAPSESSSEWAGDAPVSSPAPDDPDAWTQDFGAAPVTAVDGAQPEPEAERDRHPLAAPEREPLGGLSLTELTARLEQALGAARERDAAAPAASPESPGHGDDEPDAVVAFPRPATSDSIPASDPQTVLRNALDKLSRVSNPK